MNETQRATRLLTHYLETVWKAAGLRWDSDNAAEVAELVDLLAKGNGQPPGVLGGLSIKGIMAVMDQAAEALATDDPLDWPGWICYILEALDGETPADEYRAALEGVKRDITTRLEEGRW